MIDFSKCQCDSPGFCSLFNRVMGSEPADWKWCQKTSCEEREKYYQLLSKENPTEASILLKEFGKTGHNDKWFQLYCLSQNKRNHICKIADKYQNIKNAKIIEYIDNQTNTNTDFSNVEIICLGHSDKQFDSIKDRSYLKKVDLNKIDAGKHSGNIWSESRAFNSKKKLFSDNSEFLGFVTASWNLKYENFNQIDEFHNWDNAKVLINSKPEDKIVLCANIFCSCSWMNRKTDSILAGLFKENPKIIGRSFSKLVGIKPRKHIKVPFSNQMIAHKSIINEYLYFLSSNEIFDKIYWFCKKYAQKYLYNTELNQICHANRLTGYFMEMLLCYWFSEKDYFYLPNVNRDNSWYHFQHIKDRSKTW